MAQPRVALVSYTREDSCITLLIEARKFSFYVRYDAWPRLVKGCHQWISSGWGNHTIANLVRCSEEIRPHDVPWNTERNNRQIVTLEEVMNMSVDFKNTPSPDYPFTLIAPTAKGVTYNGHRRWFKTADDARTFAQEIYDGEPSKSFELCVVKSEDVVKPKPKTELISTWSNKQEA